MKFIQDLGLKKPKETSSYTVRYGLYECPVCNQLVEVNTNSVKSGKSTKCRACSNKEKNTTHAESKTKLYKRWVSMIQRCHNPNSPAYQYYGGKGITVFKEWRESFISFKNYVLSLDNALTDIYSLDRIDFTKGYIPGNIRWASKTLQCINQKDDKRNISGCKGVTWDKTRSKWFAQITINHKMKNLGRFDNLKDAIKARKDAEQSPEYIYLTQGGQ